MIMLAAWTEILPMFIVRWLAVHMCERIRLEPGWWAKTVVIARPDILIRLPNVDPLKKGE
jgi:hypothetical protein